jgi:cytochrome c-type biogenesis protein CcmH
MRVLVVLAILASTTLHADSGRAPSQWADLQLPDPAAEARARDLMEEIRCLVCQGQSIADSDAELAGDMRAMIRQRIAAGESPESIRSWLIERYGAWVTFDPPVEPLTWPLFAAPIAVLAIGGWLAARALRGRR